MKKFEILEHIADGKFKAYGKNLDETFKNAALAMCSLMTDTKKVKAKITKKISIEGKDLKNILYNFLEEILFLLDSENFLLKEVKKIKIVKNKLSAEIVGDNAKNYEIYGNVKAITYNSMEINEKPYSAQVIVDM